ncbi:MAG: helix-turn-helix domain-containing protein [Zoogloeaceae bacterium]|jgi:transcriptional regulator with XRE-family HTH domain|nr:helix-turn-helix domain-containing protein [Zoogloeaceae bacterium]
MNNNKINMLSSMIARKRADLGVREAARQVGISPATLSRVENGKIPDLDTFGKICRWLGEDPALFLDTSFASNTVVTPMARVHFKKDSAIAEDSARALSELILAAQRKLLQEELEG